jgi:hypothetical protein
MVLPMSRYDIADHVGIAVETVSRATEADLLNALLSTKVYCPRRKLGVAIPIGSQPIPSINILSRHFCYLPVVPPLGRFSDFRRPNSAPPKFGGASFCPGGGGDGGAHPVRQLGKVMTVVDMMFERQGRTCPGVNEVPASADHGITANREPPRQQRPALFPAQIISERRSHRKRTAPIGRLSIFQVCR